MFDWPNEHLVQVKGCFGDFLTSLSFITNKQEYGPYGKASGREPKQFSTSPGWIVGLWWHTDSQFGVQKLEVHILPDIVRCMNDFMKPDPKQDSDIL